MPKTRRYSLGARCDETLLAVLEAICRAAQSQPGHKLEPIERASASLDVAKVLFRTAKDVRAISNNDYLTIQSKIHEIGRMLGGWIKRAREKAAQP